MVCNHGVCVCVCVYLSIYIYIHIYGIYKWYVIMGCLCVCLSVCLSLCLCVCVYADRTLGATHRDQQVTEALCVYVIIF